MKILLSTIALFFSLMNSAQSEQDPFAKDALKLAKVSNDAVEASFFQVYAMIPDDRLDDLKEELKPILERYYEKVAKIYQDVYTHEQIKELLEFYESDLGQNLLEGQKEVMKKSMNMAQSLSAEMMPLIRKYQN